MRDLMLISLAVMATTLMMADAQYQEAMDVRPARAAFAGMRGRRAPFNGMRGKRGPEPDDYELLAELLEKRAPFNGMRGKRGEEVEQEVPQDLMRQFERYLIKRRSGGSMGFNGMRG